MSETSRSAAQVRCLDCIFDPGKSQPGRLSCVSAEAMAMELIVEYKKLIESEYQKTHFPTTAGKYALGNRRRKPGTSKENGGAGENCEKLVF